MKLNCELHGRRVTFLSTIPGFVHTTGENQGRCPGRVAIIGTKRYEIDGAKLQLVADTTFNPLIHTPPRKKKRRRIQINQE